MNTASKTSKTQYHEPYPSIAAAYRLTRTNSKLKSDWHCAITIELDLARQRYPKQNIKRLNHQDLERVCYHWLAEIGYHKLNVIN